MTILETCRRSRLPYGAWRSLRSGRSSPRMTIAAELTTPCRPSKLSDAASRNAWSRLERQCASPSAVIALQRMNREIDARHILPTIRVPTLVLHRSGDPNVHVDRGRYLAEQIPDAKYVELPGGDHLPYIGDSDRVADEIEELEANARIQPDGRFVEKQHAWSRK